MKDFPNTKHTKYSVNESCILKLYENVQILCLWKLIDLKISLASWNSFCEYWWVHLDCKSCSWRYVPQRCTESIYSALLICLSDPVFLLYIWLKDCLLEEELMSRVLPVVKDLLSSPVCLTKTPKFHIQQEFIIKELPSSSLLPKSMGGGRGKEPWV